MSDPGFGIFKVSSTMPPKALIGCIRSAVVTMESHVWRDRKTDEAERRAYNAVIRFLDEIHVVDVSDAGGDPALSARLAKATEGV